MLKLNFTAKDKHRKKKVFKEICLLIKTEFYICVASLLTYVVGTIETFSYVYKYIVEMRLFKLKLSQL